MPDPQGQRFDERELVAQAQAGQLSAFGVLISQSQERLYGLALRLTGSADDAAEVVQETFLRALKSIGHFQRKARFHTYMVRIMINLVNDMRKRTRREAAHLALRGSQMLQQSQAAGMLDPQNPVRSAERREIADVIHHGLDGLEPHLKQIMVLREFEQLSYRQIAEIMNVSEGTVKSRLFRAREALRTLLTPYMKMD